MARRAAVIDQHRKKTGFTLVLDAGNGLTGDRNPAKQTKGETSVTAMNMMTYDAAALGPNDLALGVDALRKRIAEADFPLLSANAFVSTTNELVAIPYIMRQLGDHTIVILGLSGGDGTQEITVRDPLEMTRQVLTEATPQADIVIVLSSAGEEENLEIADAFPAVDIIISAGTSQLASPWQSQETRTLILHADNSAPGHAGRRVGIAQLGFDAEGRLVGQQWERLDLGPEIPSDSAMAQWVGEQMTP